MASSTTSSSSPLTMRAWAYTTSGMPAKVLSLSHSIPKPKVTKPNEVLVRVTHAALNPAGTTSMFFFPNIFKHFPCIPEMDFAGRIEEVGSECEWKGEDEEGGAKNKDNMFRRGDQVFGSVPLGAHLKGSGALADYLVVDKEHVVRKPDNESVALEDVAGLGIAGCTAMELMRATAIKPGSRVLVNAATGGIGGIVVQLVKEVVGKDGLVAGLSSQRNFELAKALGAQEVTDYHKLDDYKPPIKFDLIIDCYGSQDLVKNSPRLLATTGAYVTVGPMYSKPTRPSLLYTLLVAAKNALLPAWLGGIPGRYMGVLATSNKDDLSTLARLVGENKLRIHRDQIWAFEDVMKAYDLMLTKQVRGKIIVKVQDP